MSLSINKKSMTVGLVIALIVGFVAGKSLSGGAGAPDDHAAETDTTAQIWTCSMHPQIQQPEPGDCPICGMDLIPLKTDGGNDLGPRELKLSKTARELAQIQVRPVEHLAVERKVRMVGSITYDETRLATITAWVGGRLDRLFVDYTGIPVSEGDHMVWMYSPDILAAQEELIQAKKVSAKMQDKSSKLIADSVRATLDATRDKLRLWGLSNEQIAAIEERGTASDHIQINAPIGGIVVHKNAQEGEYVKTGTPIYRIADLTHLWVKLDAYESDLSWLRYGQEVEFETEAYPGEQFKGRIAFIDPVLTDSTRTVKVRVNVPNPSGKLKPGMFVRAVARAQLAKQGKVIDDVLAGKWIGPMHPEIIQDEPGDCPICGMPLKKAEELGYVSADQVAVELPLVIPASAPLITGKRAVVYVQDPTDASRFSGRDIVLGARAGDHYLVESGLEAGELVVTLGNFKIDSALQIQAKPSMMSPPKVSSAQNETSGLSPTSNFSDLPAEFRQQFGELLTPYFAIQQALSKDNHKEAVQGAKTLAERINAIGMGGLGDKAHMTWMKTQLELKKATDLVVSGQEIEASRKGFAMLSESMSEAVKSFGSGIKSPVLKYTCPMAFNDRGAIWLQASDNTANPYFGSAMFGCGEMVKNLTSANDEKAKEHNHE